jgi:hypothetical protein
MKYLGNFAYLWAGNREAYQVSMLQISYNGLRVYLI